MEAATLPDVCNILSVTRTSDGQGGFTDTWGTATANVKCRLDLFTSRGVGLVGIEMLKSASLKPFSTWILSVPNGTTLTAAHRVEVGSDTFNVIEVDAGRSWGANVRATLERV
jgi:head-tail adaptor